MNPFAYGRVYSKLDIHHIKHIKLGVPENKLYLYLAKIYFYIFGYPDIASQRRFLMVDSILKLKSGEKLLDAGCGNGIYLQEFGNLYGIDGVGIDVRKNRIDSAKKINNDLGRSDYFVTSSLEKSELKKIKFDKAICLEVLEHIVDDAGVLKKLSKNLKKDGLFVVSIPMKGTALTKEQEEDPDFKPEKYEHVRSGYTKADIYKMAKNANLKVISINTYFFLVSRYMVKVQQFVYKKNWNILNLIISPILLLISSLDNVISIYPRGYMIVLKKK